MVGQLNQSNPDIHQEALVLPDVNAKYAWLLETLETYLSDGKILVFVNGKLDVEELNKKLNAFFQSRQLLVTLLCLQGDKDQNEVHIMLLYGNVKSQLLFLSGQISCASSGKGKFKSFLRLMWQQGGWT